MFGVKTMNSLKWTRELCTILHAPTNSMPSNRYEQTWLKHLKIKEPLKEGFPIYIYQLYFCEKLNAIAPNFPSSKPVSHNVSQLLQNQFGIDIFPFLWWSQQKNPLFKAYIRSISWCSIVIFKFINPSGTQTTSFEPSRVSISCQQGLFVNVLIMTGPLQWPHNFSLHSFNGTAHCTSH